MAYKVTIEQHAECRLGKALASYGGAHVMNFLVEEDMDNGMVVKQGDYVEIDLYKPTKGSEATFVVREQMDSGLWLIECTEPSDEFIITSVPIANAGYETREYTDDAIFYNGVGEVARGRQLSKFDTYHVNEKAVEGTLEAGKNLTVVDGKLTVGA